MANQKSVTLDAGQIWMVADGEYSDYRITGVYEVLKPFSPIERAAAVAPLLEEYWRTETLDRLLKALVAEGVIKLANCVETHAEDLEWKVRPAKGGGAC